MINIIGKANFTPKNQEERVIDIQEEIRFEFQELVCARMKQLGISEKDIAEKAGMSLSSVKSALSNGGNLTIVSMAKIAASLHMKLKIVSTK